MEFGCRCERRHLPVVEDGQLIGIISIGDVVKCCVQQIEFESAALRDYIRSTWEDSTRQGCGLLGNCSLLSD